MLSSVPRLLNDDDMMRCEKNFITVYINNAVFFSTANIVLKIYSKCVFV